MNNRSRKVNEKRPGRGAASVLAILIAVPGVSQARDPFMQPNKSDLQLQSEIKNLSERVESLKVDMHHLERMDRELDEEISSLSEVLTDPKISQNLQKGDPNASAGNSESKRVAEDESYVYYRNPNTGEMSRVKK